MLSLGRSIVALLLTTAAVPVLGNTPVASATVPAVTAAAGSAPNGSATNDDAATAYAKRTYFYAGGRYVFNATTNGTIMVDQQYVEKLTPHGGVKHENPIIFFHGGGVSGVQWLNKPDGGEGWASNFLKRGYEVYIVDIWSVGRSAAADFPTEFNSATVELTEIAFTAPQVHGKYAQAVLHNQWPGTGERGDPVFDAFYSTFEPLNFQDIQQNITRTSTCAALAIIGKPAIIISHSAGGAVGLLVSDGCPDLVKAHVSVEGDQSPFTSYDAGTNGVTVGFPTRPYGVAGVPITYNPPVVVPTDLVRVTNGTLEKDANGVLSKFPCVQQGVPARQLTNIAKVPMLFLTGEASIHACYDQCEVQYLQQAGVNVQWTQLKDVGIHGNGHFSMLEKNSGDIAQYIAKWLQGLGEKKNDRRSYPVDLSDVLSNTA